jgi:hypothetical protein
VRFNGIPMKISDHTPLIIDPGSNITFGKNKFRFEKWWLERVDFKEVVKKAWTRWMRRVRKLAEPSRVRVGT